MRTERITQQKADNSDASGPEDLASAMKLVQSLRALAPTNVLVILGIVSAFGLFGVYQVARDTQHNAQMGEMALELATLKRQMTVSGAQPGETAFYVASEASVPVDVEQSGVTPKTADNTRPTVPHLAVLGGVMTIVLLLVWRRQQPASASAPPQLVETKEPEGVFDALNMAVAHWSPDGKLIGCNGRFRTLFGADGQIVQSDVRHGDVMAALSDGADIRLMQDDEHRRVVEIGVAHGNALKMEERPLSSGGFVTLINDHSDVKGAEQALDDLREEQKLMAQQLREEKFRAEAASRAKTSFLAHLSHDVRTPLNHIIGFADLIAHQTYGPIGDKRYLNYVNDIKGSGEKLLSSFSEILELAQIEGGQLVLRRERLSVDDILTTTANRFQDAAKRAGLTFETSIPQSGLLYGDRFCLERMVGNLVDNAIQFTPNGGAVRLAAYVAEDGVVIEVSDTGIGMSEERLKDLAQPFVLGDAAFTRETSGVGLGISISRAIAELSGGAMEIDSNPAVGTTVAISLPLHAAKAEEKAA